MIDAIASRTTTGHTAHPIASTAITDRIASANLPEADVTSSMAVIKTISEKAQQAASDWNTIVAANGHAEISGQSGEERERATQAYFDLLSERMNVDSNLRIVTASKQHLARNQASYSKLLASEPVPATRLEGEAKSAAQDLMKQLGIHRRGDLTIFLNEGTRYLAYADGTIEAHDADIATTAEEKQTWLANLSRQIADGERDPAPLQAAYDDLSARIEAIRAHLFKNL